MPWPVPTLLEIEQTKQISLRKWLPTLSAIAIAAAGGVLLLWPHGKPTHTLEFWCILFGAPLIIDGLSLGWLWIVGKAKNSEQKKGRASKSDSVCGVGGVLATFRWSPRSQSHR